MAINTSSSALNLNLPSSGPSVARGPSLVTIHPSVIAQILDHHARRPTTAGSPPPTRVIGTLLGLRVPTAHGDEVEVRSCFAVPHSEDEEHIAVDMDYHRGMMELVGKLGGRREAGGHGEVIVGWYATSPTINAYSALIQNFFSQECAAVAGQAVHLTVDAELSAQEGATSGLGVKAYISSQVGATPKPENCIFLPVPCALKYTLAERAGLDLLAPSTANAAGSAPSTSVPPLATLSASLAQLSTHLASVQEYVRAVNAGTASTPPDAEVGRYLLEAVGRWRSDAARAGANGEDGEEDEGVRKGLQDLLSVSYLSTLLRSQVELSARLNLMT